MSTAIDPEVMPPAPVALEVPKKIEAMLTEPTRFEIEANAFEVVSEASYQVADQIKETLKAEAKTIDNTRLEEFVRPLNKIADRWTSFFSPHIEGRKNAALTLARKMLAYKAEHERKKQAAQREADRLVQAERQKELDRAQKLEAKAAQLKTESAKDKIFAEADRIREAAAMMPESVAISASEPQTVASDIRDNWKGEPKLGRLADALRWLADHPEWSDVVEFKAGPMKRMAKQFHNVPEKAEPFRFWNEQGFATKRR